MAYDMVLTEQRGATVVAVPRLGAEDGRAIDAPAVRAAAAAAAVQDVTESASVTVSVVGSVGK